MVFCVAVFGRVWYALNIKSGLVMTGASTYENAKKAQPRPAHGALRGHADH